MDKARVFNLLQDQRRLHVRILQGLHACNDITAQSARSFVFYVRSITAVLHGNLRLGNHCQASHWTSTVSSKASGHISERNGCSRAGLNNLAIAQLVEHLTVGFCGNQMVPGSIPGGQIMDSYIICHLSKSDTLFKCSATLPCF